MFDDVFGDQHMSQHDYLQLHSIMCQVMQRFSGMSMQF